MLINNNILVASTYPFVLFAGPCAIESKQHAVDTASTLKEITDELSIPFVYKSSFDKANRTSINSPRGVGLALGTEILAGLRSICPVMTDVHEQYQVSVIKNWVDVIQIPAFLCRQTDLLVAAGESGKPVMIKKGQFASPMDVISMVEKVASTGNNSIAICERGSSFGYNNIVVDMRALETMRNEALVPVIFDATHSAQARNNVFALARAAVAVGVAGVFMETHENPDKAPSDGKCMLPLKDMKSVLTRLKEIDAVVKRD